MVDKSVYLRFFFKTVRKLFKKIILYWNTILKLVHNVLVSGIQQSDSVIYIHVSILFQVLFPLRLLQNIEQSSLCFIKSSFEKLENKDATIEN